MNIGIYGAGHLTKSLIKGFEFAGVEYQILLYNRTFDNASILKSEFPQIEIVWRFIKYKWLPFDAFLNFNNLKERLNDILESVGSKYIINFY